MSRSLRTLVGALILSAFVTSAVPAQTEETSTAANIKAELTKLEQQLSDLQKKAETRKEQAAQIKRQYNSAVDQAGSRCKQAKKELKKRAKEAGVDGFAALFPDKTKAAIIKSIKAERKKIEEQRKAAIAQAKAEYDQAMSRLRAQAKAEKKETDRQKAKLKKQHKRIKGKLKAALKDEKSTRKAKTKARAREIRERKAQLRKEYEQNKAKEKQKAKAEPEKKEEAKAKQKTDNKINAQQAKAQAEKRKKAKTDYKKVKAQTKKAVAEAKKKLKRELKALKKAPAENKAEKEAQIRAEYKKTVAKIRLKLKYAEAKLQHPDMKLYEDPSTPLAVKEIRIGGNTLIPTDELLKDLPAVYAVTESQSEETEHFYDFGVFHDIILNPGEPRQVPQKTIQQFTACLLSVYEQKGYAGIYVYVPKENVTAVDGTVRLKDDVLRIEVLESTVAKITINRYDFDREPLEKGWLKDSVIESWSPAKKGTVINEKELDDFVRLLNLNPDRYIAPVVSRSDKPNALDVAYDVYEANPWHWFFQIDNSGVDKQHEWSPRVGLVNTNLTGMDDELSIMYQTKPIGSEYMQDNYSLFGSYEIPFLTPRLRLKVLAGYSEFDTTAGASSVTNISFRGTGLFYGAAARYNLFQVEDWMFDFIGTFTHERSRMTPSIFSSFLEQNVSMNLLGFGTEISRTGDMAETSVRFMRTFTAGGGSSADDFQLARTGADDDFGIYTLSASHRQFLDKTKVHELSGAFTDIIPDKRLVPAKMTTFGGLYSVRGYEEDEVIADGGILGSVQYRFDLTKYLEKDYLAATQERLWSSYKELWPPDFSFLAFLDYGRAKNKNHVAGEPSIQELMGMGLGVGVDMGNNFSGRVYYGWPLLDIEEPGKTQGGDAGVWNFNFVYRW